MSIVFLVLMILVVGYGFTVFFGAPYVPTLKADVEKAFRELYQLKSGDVLLDLGSGDGKVLRIAARQGTKAIGYELHPVLVLISRLLSRGLPITTKLTDVWRTPFPDDTTVVYVFAVSRDVRKFSRLIQREASRLGRPLMVVTYGAELPNIKHIRTVGAHHLFTVIPLQGREAQV